MLTMLTVLFSSLCVTDTNTCRNTTKQCTPASYHAPSIDYCTCPGASPGAIGSTTWPKPGNWQRIVTGFTATSLAVHSVVMVMVCLIYIKFQFFFEGEQVIIIMTTRGTGTVSLADEEHNMNCNFQRCLV